MKFPLTSIPVKQVDIPRALFFSLFSPPIMVIICITYFIPYITAIEDIQNHKFVFYNGIKVFLWIVGLFIYQPLHSYVMYIGRNYYHIPVYILAIVTGIVWAFWDVMPMMMMHDAQLHSFWLLVDIFAAGVFWVWISFFLFDTFLDSPKVFASTSAWVGVSFFFLFTNITILYLLYVYNRDKETNQSRIVQFGDAVLSLFGIHEFSLKRVNTPIRLGFLENNRVLL